MLGGMMGPMQAAVAVMAAPRSSSKPSRFMAGIMIIPMATAVATADPEMAAKIAQAMTVAWPSPPRMCPITSLAKRTRSSVRPPSFIRLPASMNSGIASSGNEVMPPKMVWGRMVSSMSGLKSR